MTMTVVVRPAVPADLDALTGLFEGYLAFYEVDVETARAHAYLAGHIEDATAIVLVAALDEDPGALVGFAQSYPTWDSLALAPRWVLYDLFVAPSARRHGVGRALLRAVIDAAGAAGAVSVSLETAHDNHGAQALYESEGFAHDLVFRTYVHELGGGGA
jgi:ribosomal protein S18 acetylase RimI-like enzyme